MTPNLKYLLTAAVLAAAGSAHATAGTDSLAGWSVLGDAVADAGALWLTTAYAQPGDPDAPFNLSGADAAEAGALEAAAGVAAYALDLSPAQYATEGSLIWQSFSVQAGQTLRFDWSFSTRDDEAEDHAFVVLDGQVLSLASRSTPGAGTQSFSHTWAGTGLAAFAVGVVDTVDYLGVSTLRVGALQISPVPEPPPAALLLAGMGLLGAAAVRSRRG